VIASFGHSGSHAPQLMQSSRIFIAIPALLQVARRSA
jgi:hypothetical protein